MNADEVFLKLKEILVEDLGLLGDEVTLGGSFEKDLGLDSLDCVEIRMSVEEEFGIEIDDDEADTVRTVEDAVKLIVEKLEGGR